jgi:hypothetical protein
VDHDPGPIGQFNRANLERNPTPVGSEEEDDLIKATRVRTVEWEGAMLNDKRRAGFIDAMATGRVSEAKLQATSLIVSDAIASVKVVSDGPTIAGAAWLRLTASYLDD